MDSCEVESGGELSTSMNKDMHILIDARFYGLENTGIGRYLVNLIGELSKIDKHNNYTLLLKKKYFNVLNLPKNWKKVQCDIKHYSFEEQIKLPKILNQINPDLVHFPHFNVPIFWKGKFIVTIHDMTMHNTNFQATKLSPFVYRIKRILYKYIIKRAIENSAKIITPTITVKSEIEEYYNVKENNIYPIYEGVDNIYSETIANKSILIKYNIEDKYFIYTGNFYPHKNIESIIRAISILNQNLDEKVMLTLAGSNKLFKEKIQEEIKRNRVEKYVKFIGYVSDQDLANLYKNSVGFIYPSLSEGFGLQGLEAMAAGTLLLSSNISVFKEVYKDNPIYFNPSNTLSMSNAMKKTLHIRLSERKNKITRAQKFVKKYSWTKMALETIGIYQKVLSI